ncbi:MAG: hypothetical protein ACREM1_23415, partial [Longimicrobiales bacterium]
MHAPRRSCALKSGLGLVALAVLLTGVAGRLAAQAQYDIQIRGARVLDGTGNPWFAADIGITDGRIAAIGDLEPADAAAVVDAPGLYVAPGFI